MTMTDPNAARSMMLDEGLFDALDDIEESRRRCLHSSPRLQAAILKAAAIVTKIQELKNGHNAATTAKSDSTSDAAGPASLGAADLPGATGPE